MECCREGIEGYYRTAVSVFMNLSLLGPRSVFNENIMLGGAIQVVNCGAQYQKKKRAGINYIMKTPS
jgi:hypothetical protein